MKCSNCSNILNGDEKFCPNCGVKIFNETVNTFDSKAENMRTASIILGLIAVGGISFFGVFFPISLILSIIGLILAIKANKRFKNAIGIVLNSVALFLSLVIATLIVLAFFFVYGIVDYGIDKLNITKYDHGDPVVEYGYGNNF